MGKLLQFPASLDRKPQSAEQEGAAEPSEFVTRCAELSEAIASLDNALRRFHASAENHVARNDRLKLRARKSEIQTQIASARRLLSKEHC